MSSDAGTVRGRDAVEQELDGEARAFWDAASRRLAREINAGWWLSGWLPWAAGIAATGTFAVLYARWRNESAGTWTLVAVAVGIAAAAAVVWWRTRARFETVESARVRLEDALDLDARLTAAAAGVGSWPTPVSANDMRWPVAWRWQRPAAVAAFLGCLLAVSAWLPFGGLVAERPHVIERPTEARTVEQWLDALGRETAVDERGIEKTEAQLAEILERPADDWYEHATLEAAGALKERTEAALRELAENLATAERAAEKLAAMMAALPPDLRDRLLDELKAAAEGLQKGDFQPPAGLADMLRQMQACEGGACDKGAMRRLADALEANREALQKALAAAPGLDREAMERAFAQAGASGERTGRGGIERGRGDADLTLGEERDLGTTRTEKADLSIDPDRAAPDEVLAVVDGAHDIDETAYKGPQAGGTVAHEGDGGMAAQVDALLPAERAAVRRFFE